MGEFDQGRAIWGQLGQGIFVNTVGDSLGKGQFVYTVGDSLGKGYLYTLFNGTAWARDSYTNCTVVNSLQIETVVHAEHTVGDNRKIGTVHTALESLQIGTVVHTMGISLQLRIHGNSHRKGI